ncbi:MAG: cobalt transporter CbiM [Deltaproteobacteria bacterium]|nr:cobalt transporter CbiM [Deltaproteobacteria bacterium]
MHITEGVLAWPVLAAGAAVAAGGAALALKRLEEDRIPQAGILAAGFFVASLVHVPIGPSNVHLVMNGLLGLLLGWTAFPAILVGLILQAALFQFGGFTTLGVNTVIMAAPAVTVHYLFRAGVRSDNRTLSLVSSFLCGAAAVLMGSLLVAASLVFTGEAFLGVARLVVVAHLPVTVIEGVITAFCVVFLKRVKPEILEVLHAR